MDPSQENKCPKGLYMRSFWWVIQADRLGSGVVGACIASCGKPERECVTDVEIPRDVRRRDDHHEFLAHCIIIGSQGGKSPKINN